ncbi:hypothetical protein C9374_013164 [Naegleria lovaniensis]|uniref:Uncharacterized protein n=1 Tax=Naegleria lovaniensis TaxID=51637 RepID=A0AA88KB42_NAELO|nr:uncharacterized protein C9374_013164 [Naegleria lovaniensis]KAG2372800.1 hypothetical protein C9374_013164 [Naegleria lovaniensis]
MIHRVQQYIPGAANETDYCPFTNSNNQPVECMDCFCYNGLSCCSNKNDKLIQVYLEARINQTQFPKCFEQLRKLKCIACSPSSYLFANSSIQIDPDSNSEISTVTPIICQDFCVELVSACQQENATYTDPNENNQYVNVFPYDITPQVLCGIEVVNPSQNSSSESMVRTRWNEWKLMLKHYVDRTLKVLSSTVSFFTKNDEWSIENSEQFSTITVDDIPVGVSLHCNANLNKLQHCYPGTSMIVDSAFMTSILVFVWVVGVAVSAIVAGIVFICKWKTRSYQQIM